MLLSCDKLHKGYNFLVFWLETLTIPYPHESATLTNWRHWKWTPARPRIHLPVKSLRLVHLGLTVGWQLERGVLGYPKPPLGSLQTLVWYPSTLVSWCRPTVRGKCARIPRLRRRLITFASGVEIHSWQMDMQVRCPARGNYISGSRSSLVLGLRYLFENGNYWKSSEYFVHETQICNKSWLSVNFFFMP